jgi:dipeptidyl aminopeptidase/acylaminoacyl peptidase
MKTFLVWCLLLFLGTTLYAQKPALDLKALQNWPVVGGPVAITNDGKYVCYDIFTDYLHKTTTSTLYLQATNSHWKKVIPGVFSVSLTADNRAIYQRHDTLFTQKLGSDQQTAVSGVANYRLFKVRGKEWLEVSYKNHDLAYTDLAKSTEERFSGVLNSRFASAGTSVLLKKATGLYWADLSGNEQLITGDAAENYLIDEQGTHAAWLTSNGDLKKIFLYDAASKQTTELADSHTDGIDSSVFLEGIDHFSHDGRRLFVRLKNKPLPVPAKDAVMVDLWSWTDAKLQSQQLVELRPKSYLSVIDNNSKKLIRLQQKDENISELRNDYDENLVITAAKADYSEHNWNPLAKPKYYLINTANGIKTALDVAPESISPDHRFIVGKDSCRLDFCSYDVFTGRTVNLTSKLPVPLVDSLYDRPEKTRGLLISGWFPAKNAAFFIDDYDIWQIALDGKIKPVCLTKGYGRLHNITFRLTTNDREIFSSTNNLVVSAFDNVTKKNGFYRFGVSFPEPLIMENCLISAQLMQHTPAGALPVKSLSSNNYIVSKQDAGHAMNLYFTSDFKSFKKLTHNYPENNYNWVTSELVNFCTLDGRAVQGVLYKPENFNPNKRYPVIIHYYERLSNELNLYHVPELSADNINIPWYVSRGYLVFTPDIWYKEGHPGMSAVNAVLGAANLLKRFLFVDSTRMGIMGHSWGGFQTDFIVTHTHIFAAAISASGMADITSGYGAVVLEGIHKQSVYEYGQTRIGKDLWNGQQLYLENSSVLNADKITTPLLLINNKGDLNIPFAQGEELFTALRRLGKEVWMLQYDGESHSIINNRSKLDYTIRMTQFFDHYLMGKPSPNWLKYGIPADKKGIETGY